MRSMIQICLVAVSVLASVSTTLADQKSHRQAAEEFLKATNVDKQLYMSIDKMVDMQVKANPQIAPQADVLKRFLLKHMSWDSMKEDLITIYVDAFTEEEIRQVAAFYQTPAGKKVIEKMPELMTKGMELGVRRVQENKAELEQMLRSEGSKVQNQE